VNTELEKRGNEVVVTYLEVISWYKPRLQPGKLYAFCDTYIQSHNSAAEMEPNVALTLKDWTEM
jgi:hypothetical protein